MMHGASVNACPSQIESSSTSGRCRYGTGYNWAQAVGPPPPPHTTSSPLMTDQHSAVQCFIASSGGDRDAGPR